jgi:hypothetical protein
MYRHVPDAWLSGRTGVHERLVAPGIGLRHVENANTIVDVSVGVRSLATRRNGDA